jgi:hypothetical protein
VEGSNATEDRRQRRAKLADDIVLTISQFSTSKNEAEPAQSIELAGTKRGPAELLIKPNAR